MAYDKEAFIKDWNSGMTVRKMADKYGISSSNVSKRALKVLGLESRQVKLDNEKERQIVEYYKTASILNTAKRFKVSKITVQRAVSSQGFSKLKMPRRRNYTVSRQEEIKQVVRVLDNVPDDFKAPTRGFGW